MKIKEELEKLNTPYIFAAKDGQKINGQVPVIHAANGSIDDVMKLMVYNFLYLCQETDADIKEELINFNQMIDQYLNQHVNENN